MKLDLQEVKEWLRVDGDDENDIISLIMRSAERYIYNATGRREFGEDEELAKTTCHYFITHMYEDRSFYNPTPQSVKKPFITMAMTQLQLGGDDNAGNKPNEKTEFKNRRIE